MALEIERAAESGLANIIEKLREVISYSKSVFTSVLHILTTIFCCCRKCNVNAVRLKITGTTS